MARRRDARLGAGVTALGSPWPVTAASRDGGLVVGGVPAEELARRFGTPLYVYDAATLRERARAYVDGVAEHPDAHVSFACKACCTVGVLRLLGECGLGADVASAGELAAALRAGIAPERIVVHGNGKTDADIDAAVAAGCGAAWCWTAPTRARAWPLQPRGTAGASPSRCASRRGSWPAVTRRSRRRTRARSSAWRRRTRPRRASRRSPIPGSTGAGLHVHLGSQVDDPGVLEGVVRWFREFCDAHALEPRLIDVGGGLGIPYGHESAPDARALAAAVAAAARRHFPDARLLIEPGRSVAGPAGITLYRVLTRKTAADGTRWVALDGGMADNARPALYGARYTVAAAGRLHEPQDERVALAGRHCESGDVLARDVDLPSRRGGRSRGVRGDRAPTASRWRRPTTPCRASPRCSSTTARRSC